MSKVDRYFRLAAQVAAKGSDQRHYRIGAVGVRSDGVIVVSNNSLSKEPQKKAHAEARLARKLNKNSVVFVVRILRNGELASARPCSDCQKALRGRGVSRVYYAIDSFEYGVLEL